MFILSNFPVAVDVAPVFSLTFYLSTIFLFRFLLLFLYGAKIGSLTSAKANFNEFTAYFIDMCEYERIAIKPHWPSAYFFRVCFFSALSLLVWPHFHLISFIKTMEPWASHGSHFCDGWITLWARLRRIHFEFNVTIFNYVQVEESEREIARRKASHHSNRYFNDE